MSDDRGIVGSEGVLGQRRGLMGLEGGDAVAMVAGCRGRGGGGRGSRGRWTRVGLAAGARALIEDGSVDYGDNEFVWGCRRGGGDGE